MNIKRLAILFTTLLVLFLGIGYCLRTTPTQTDNTSNQKNNKNDKNKDTTQIQTLGILDNFRLIKTKKDTVTSPKNPFTFEDEQRKFTRVRAAFLEKEDSVKKILLNNGIINDSVADFDIYQRAFKAEKIIELWAKAKNQKKFTFLKTYDFCVTSGELGAKLKSGDKQIPEGFYFIDRFNPQSTYHLSLGINYPNKVDKIIGDTLTGLGSDIFIHGNCVTVGCIPITDDKIKELYVFATKAKSSGQKKIAVTIFPDRLTDANFEEMKRLYASKPKTIKFWAMLKKGYDYFERCKELPTITITPQGEYKITSKCK